MANLKITSSDLTTVLTSIPVANPQPGKPLSELFGLNNNYGAAITGVYMDAWPGVQGDQATNVTGTPVKSIKIIRQDANETFKATQVVKEDADAVLTKFESIVKCFLYSGGTYTEYTDSDEIPLLSAPSDYLYILCDQIFYVLYFSSFKTYGSYTGLTAEIYYNGAWTACPTGEVDGTSGWTTEGFWTLGAVTESNWAKTTINGAYGYPVRFKCSAVTTQAVMDTGSLFWHYVWDFAKPCLFKPDTLLTYYEKDDEASPGYTSLLASPEKTWGNMGRVAFSADPLTDIGNHSLVADYYYKTPVPGLYNLTFPSDVNHVVVNSGSPIAIIADGTTKHYNVIAGCEIIFSTSLTVGDETNIRISESLQYTEFAAATGGYSDRILLGDFTTAQTKGFYIRTIYPMSATGTNNNRNIKLHAYGD